MINKILMASLMMLSSLSCKSTDIPQVDTKPIVENNNGKYTLVVEGFDWGAAVSKVILNLEDSLADVNGTDFEVFVNRATDCEELSEAEATGKLKVQYAYVSDAEANKTAKGMHVTLVIFTAPFEQLGSPIKYFFRGKCSGNKWIDYRLSIFNSKNHRMWNEEAGRVIPTIEGYALDGSHTHGDITIGYASYNPINRKEKSPLIIWLHGGGEGGSDTTIPLLANKAANYASSEIQSYFEGAHVLVPQSPTFWMDKGDGTYTRGEVDDMYNESLMSLIKEYVTNNNIDADRIYLGGCSNGGYMTVKLLLNHPGYFAAAFPSALAYHNDNITDAHVESLKNEKIWFIHSKDDPVTKADETVVPLYHRLMNAGAKDVHFSFFDHVIDVTNQFGGDKFNYNGHFSWVYSHTNMCQLDYDGSPVKIDNRPVSLMAWLAEQRR